MALVMLMSIVEAVSRLLVCHENSSTALSVEPVKMPSAADRGAAKDDEALAVVIAAALAAYSSKSIVK